MVMPKKQQEMEQSCTIESSRLFPKIWLVMEYFGIPDTLVIFLDAQKTILTKKSCKP